MLPISIHIMHKTVIPERVVSRSGCHLASKPPAFRSTYIIVHTALLNYRCNKPNSSLYKYGYHLITISELFWSKLIQWFISPIYAPTRIGYDLSSLNETSRRSNWTVIALPSKHDRRFITSRLLLQFKWNLTGTLFWLEKCAYRTEVKSLFFL